MIMNMLLILLSSLSLPFLLYHQIFIYVFVLYIVSSIFIYIEYLPFKYFVLKDFRSYVDTQRQVEIAYKNKMQWGKMALLNTASCGKFSSDRTIKEYAEEIWKLTPIEL